jgi:hypothetical protein
MTIPNSGVKFSAIATEFGGVAQHSISEYYRGGENVSSLQPTSTIDGRPISTSGQISAGMFRGLANDGLSAATAGRSAYQIKQSTGTTADGMYWIRVSNHLSPIQVYCDMNTDGGGWMLIARTHPSVAATSWGWQSNANGSVSDFSQPYQMGWRNWLPGAVFSEFLVGNRKNLYTNEWGPFIYKRFNFSYYDLFNTDTQQTASGSVIKSDLSVYDNPNFPGMQWAIGFPISGSNILSYYMRDCCGFSSYGLSSTGMITAYVNHATIWHYAGPWAISGGFDGSGNFIQNSGDVLYGGTNQAMIMVR